MNSTIQKACALSGLIGVTVFFLGIVSGGFFPPWSPALGVEEVVAIYQENKIGLLLGGILLITGGAFVFPFIAVISQQIRRIEGNGPLLTYVQLAAGVGGIMYFIVPEPFYAVTAYRAEILSPEIIYFMNDFNFLTLLIVWQPAAIQNISIAVAIFNDKNPNPLFPRWVAYLNIWVALGFVCILPMPFFYDGVFSWAGLFPFWIPATVFGLWFIVMTYVLFKAIDNTDYSSTKEHSV